MQRIFPPALLACINEGRPPRPQELESVTERVLREAFGHGSGYGRRHAAAMARAALAGVDGDAPVGDAIAFRALSCRADPPRPRVSRPSPAKVAVALSKDARATSVAGPLPAGAWG